jgi:hypothetical protein
MKKPVQVVDLITSSVVQFDQDRLQQPRCVNVWVQVNGTDIKLKYDIITTKIIAIVPT